MQNIYNKFKFLKKTKNTIPLLPSVAAFVTDSVFLASLPSVLLWTVLASATMFESASASASVSYIDDYSLYNEIRPKLANVGFIILHSTEGEAKGSLAKLKLYGEAHYLVERNGTIHRLLEPDRLAFHAGRSIWNGVKNLDEISLGIELEGFHDKPATTIQELALKDLLAKLQGRFKIPDKNVLTHSMVAYGLPNFWHTSSHRGRKRCAMLLALDQVRQRLGLTPLPKIDPDVAAGRLIVGDEWLFALLYQGQNVLAKNSASEFSKPVQAAATASTTTASVTAAQPAVVATAATTTKATQPSTEKTLNIVTKERSAWFIARDLYDDPATVYYFPSESGVKSVRRGDQIKDWGNIPIGTEIRFTTTSGKEEVESLPTRSTNTRVFEIGKDGDTAFSIARAEFASNTTIYFFSNNKISSGARLLRENAGLLARLPRGTKIIIGYKYGGKITADTFVSHLGGSKIWNDPGTLYRLPNGKFISGAKIKQNQIISQTIVFFEE